MNTNQVKASVETAKEVMNDKALKSKGDKERRLREKKEQNTKKFMQERKTVQMKQGREKEKLQKSHEKQVAGLDGDIDAVNSRTFVLTNNIYYYLTYKHIPRATGKKWIFKLITRERFSQQLKILKILKTVYIHTRSEHVISVADHRNVQERSNPIRPVV